MNEPFIFEKTFPEGPKIAIHLKETSDGKTKIHLFKSEIFTACFSMKSEKTPPNEHLLNWLTAYSQKENLPTLNLYRQKLPTFSEKVLNIINDIPFGKTLSYGEIAEKAGSPQACRAVGTICRLNAWPLFIPCHRVLHKTELTSKYAFGALVKKALLEFE